MTRDLYTNADVARTHMDQLNRYAFRECTIEASFRLANASGDQVLLSKEEDQAGTILPLFQLGVFGNPPRIGVELVDQAGEKIVIQSSVQAEADAWYHVALTIRDGLAKLYVVNDSETADFKLAKESHLQGALAQQGGTWVVGRGCEVGKFGRDFSGWIDEVRISTKALEMSQFLFAKRGQELEAQTD
jgi:hypothetical protein